MLLGILHHVESPQPLTVAGIQQNVVDITLLAEPMAAGSPQVVGVHPDPLHLPELDEPVPADEEREDGRDGCDGSESPIRLLYEVLEVHAVQTGQESPHGQTKCAHAKLEVKKHERVSICVKNGSDTIRQLVSARVHIVEEKKKTGL